MKKKIYLLMVVIFLIIIFIIICCSKFNNKKNVDTNINEKDITETSNYEEWYNIESIIDNSRFRDLENNIKLSGFEKEETSCGSFLIYPIKIDGKSIHTYSEEVYMEKISTICLCSFNCLTSNDYNSLLSFPDDYKLLDVRNTKGSVNYRINNNNLIIENSKLKHGLYIIKLEIDKDNIVEVLFY